VIRGSSCRREPAAAFRGLAKGFSPASESFRFNSWKASTCMSTSPRTERKGGAFRSSSLSRRGTVGIVRTFSVTPSPRIPSPRVEARTRIPFSYTSSTEAPSILGSTTYATEALPRAFRSLSSKRLKAASSESESRLSMGAACTTSGNRSKGTPPTLWVGESGVTRSGNLSSISLSSLKSRSYSSSEISGASST